MEKRWCIGLKALLKICLHLKNNVTGVSGRIAPGVPGNFSATRSPQYFFWYAATCCGTLLHTNDLGATSRSYGKAVTRPRTPQKPVLVYH